MALLAANRAQEAAVEFERGIDAEPELPELHLNLAAALIRLERLDAARAQYEAALRLDPGSEAAHWALYELEQVSGRRERALAHQSAALELRATYSAYAPHERRRLLVLMAPGDLQANVPIDYLADAQTTTVHKLYLLSQEQARAAALPSADAVFTGIAESHENRERLRWAQELAKRSRLPVINEPRCVAGADRPSVARIAARIDGLRVPQTLEIPREELRRASLPLEYPLVVRPAGSQGGRALEKITGAQALRDYAERIDEAQFYVMPFVEYASGDGYYRKYRLFVVGDRVYPCHLAISPEWMIHYYNAPMRENAWMRDEERDVLLHFDRAFPAALQNAACALVRALGLDYAGLDCAIGRDGDLLIFEADPAMIVHAADDPLLFAYKHEPARRIFHAFQELIDRARPR